MSTEIGDCFSHYTTVVLQTKFRIQIQEKTWKTSILKFRNLKQLFQLQNFTEDFQPHSSNTIIYMHMDIYEH